MSGKPVLTWRSLRQKRRYSRAMDLVEERLAAVAGASEGVLGQACRATLTAGGKRLRPFLTLLCARPGRPLGEPVLRAAVAVELLHMASLVHDDVLDRAELRRGRPTVAREFGVDLAVSAGNHLMACAFMELAGAGHPPAVEVLSRTAVGLSEGEILQRDEAHDVRATQVAYERRCERKTAGLFAAACRLGAMLSGAGEETIAAVGEYGRLSGLAFQVFDDILDCTGDEVTTGKQPGADVRDGTITLPLIYLLETRPDLAPVLGAAQPSERDVAAVLEAVAASDALERARAVALRYIDQARSVLDRCSDPIERELLDEIAAQVVDRYS